MSRARRTVFALLTVAVAAACSSCGGGKRFYPVRGTVFANGKPAEGVTVVFHPADDPDPRPVQPSAVVQADGSFTVSTWLVEDRVVQDGAPPGQYQLTCVWYPPNLQHYLGRETLPDRLRGKYASPKTSGLRAEVSDGPTELPPIQLETLY